MLLVNGATHGDEYEGPTLLRTWAEQWRPTRLAGTVVFVPVLNEAAFFAGQRCAPVDGANLARVFPGKPKGSPTERLAHLFDTQLLAQVTHYADLHSAGAAYQLKPWTGYVTHRAAINRAQRAMAACFDAFWVWAGPYLPGRTLSAAFARNIPAIYVECQGLGGVDAGDLRNLDRGLKNLLHWAGLTRGCPGCRSRSGRLRRTGSRGRGPRLRRRPVLRSTGRTADRRSARAHPGDCAGGCRHRAGQPARTAGFALRSRAAAGPGAGRH